MWKSTFYLFFNYRVWADPEPTAADNKTLTNSNDPGKGSWGLFFHSLPPCGIIYTHAKWVKILQTHMSNSTI